MKKSQIILFVLGFIISISIHADTAWLYKQTKDTIPRDKHGIPIVDFDCTIYKIKPGATICFFDDSHGLADDGVTVTWHIESIYWWAKKNIPYNIAARWIYDGKIFLDKHYKGIYNLNEATELPFMNTEGQPDVDPKESMFNCYHNYSSTSDFYIRGTVANAGISLAHPFKIDKYKGDSAIEINTKDQEKYRTK